jgi:RNA polymerase sigma-70 factor (ECF subfamily)
MNVNAARADHGSVSSEDIVLASRCKQGDPTAFARLLRRYRKGVYRVAYAILGNPDDAQDAAQEAFVRAYTAIQSLDHNRSFADWIRRIAVNCAISSLRKRKRAARNVSPGADVGSAVASVDPVQHAAASDLQRQLRAALDALPPRQRAAMTLFALQDMELTDVADAMGCAAPTARVHLHRARRKLRKLLAEYLAENASVLKEDESREM